MYDKSRQTCCNFCLIALVNTFLFTIYMMSSVANNSSIQFNAGDIALNDETYLMNKGI